MFFPCGYQLNRLGPRRPTRLEQVIVNLLSNAAKYADDGGHVWLTVQQEDDEVEVRVRDTGLGIALCPALSEICRSLNEICRTRSATLRKLSQEWGETWIATRVKLGLGDGCATLTLIAPVIKKS